MLKENDRRVGPITETLLVGLPFDGRRALIREQTLWERERLCLVLI